MDKSEDLSKKYEISKDEEIEDYITDHKTHTHSNGKFPLASKSLPLSSHTAFILTPLAKPNNIEQCKYEISQFLLGI